MKRLSPDIIFNSEQLNSNLSHKSVTGGMVIIAANIVAVALSMIGTIILARLLTPYDYGLVGMVMVFVRFAQMFKDGGLSLATVQKESISHPQISTLFWFNVLISSFLGLCILISSPCVAWLYKKPELIIVTAVLSLPFFINGFTIQHKALLHRHMQFKNIAFIEIASQVSSLIVTVLLALLGCRYWSLVGGSIALALSTTGLIFFFCPWKPDWIKRGTGSRKMLKFGMHVTGFSFFDYLTGNSDNILIGKFIGAEALGLYSKGYNLMKLPIDQISRPLNRVTVPVLSTLKNQPDRYVKYYQRLINIIATLSVPISLYCIIEANFLIKVFLGQKWLGVIPVFRILALAALIHAAAGTRGLVMISHGFTKKYFYLGIFKGLFTIICFAIGIRFGIIGVATGYTISKYVLLIPLSYCAFQNTPITVTLFLRTFAIPMLIGLVATGSVALLKYTGMGDSVASHIVYASIFVVIYFGLSLCRLSIRETLHMILKAYQLRSIKL